jgi:catechol 2,3-dioxygenase-like lactoylglutathione lyase family enzyme
MRLTAALLYVKDLQRMAAFYSDMLGLKPIDETRLDTWLEFDAGGSGFALHATPAQIADQIEIASPPVPRETNPVKLIFEVEDVATECNRLASLGVTIIQRPWGTYDGLDPEGNIFQICASKTR